VIEQLAAGKQALPSLPVTDLGALPIGTPEQLLRRRPDLVQAERQLAAATADVGVATADLFPRVSLTGLIGLAGLNLGSLGNGSSQQYALGAGLTWPLLDFGRVRSRISASDALVQAEVAQATGLVAVYRALGGGWPQGQTEIARTSSHVSAAGHVSSAAEADPLDTRRR